MIAQLFLVILGTTIVAADGPPPSTVQNPEPNIPYDFPETTPTKKTLLHLFEWKWTDIAKECENFLQYYGYGAVQVSPPQEHVVLKKDNFMPWWIRYQPVSYKLESRSGSEKEFKDMVERCNKVGVRIVVDAVLNHMTGVDMVYGKNGVSSSAGSYFDSTNGKENFPEVPYCHNDTNDFRCDRNINGDDYAHNAENVRICRLDGLIDLNQDDDCVQEKMVEYLNKMINMGVAGFRFDASKHMFPDDLHAIIYKLNDLKEDVFGKGQRPFCVHEISDLGGGAVTAEPYLSAHIGRYTDFNYGVGISQKVWRYNDVPPFSDLAWWGQGYGHGSYPSTNILAFIDNHDTQRGSPPTVLTYKNGDAYKLAVGFMLSWNYGYPRVMSSYRFDNRDQGPPHQQDDVYEIKSPEFDPKDKTCTEASGWVCEHRWQAIRNMAVFRQVVTNTTTTIQHYEGQHLAFSRGDKGFFAANNDYNSWNIKIKTNLPFGIYCNLWNGELQPDKKACTGGEIFVDRQSNAYIEVPSQQFIAMHVAEKLDICVP